MAGMNSKERLPECHTCRGEPVWDRDHNTGQWEEALCVTCHGVGLEPPPGGWQDDPDYGPGRRY